MFVNSHTMLSAAAIGIGIVCVTTATGLAADLPVTQGGYQYSEREHSERVARDVRWHHRGYDWRREHYVRAAPRVIERRTVIEQPTIIEHRTIVERPIIERRVVVTEPLVSAAVVPPPPPRMVVPPFVAYGPDDED